MGKQAKPLEDFWDRPLQILLQQLQATPAGLTTDEAKRRLRLYGPNSMMQELRFAGLLTFLRLFANPLVVILLVASGISLGLGDDVGGLIIIAIVLLSVLLNFFMEFQARHAVEEIRKQVATTAAVVLPYTPVGSLLGFIPLPLSLLAAIAGLAVTYLLVVQAVKSWFYRRHALL